MTTPDSTSQRASPVAHTEYILPIVRGPPLSVSGLPTENNLRVVSELQLPARRIPSSSSPSRYNSLAGRVCLAELQQRQQILRPVSPTHLPLHLGGKHASHRHEDSPLKKELLCKAAEIQTQLRPRIQDFQQTQKLRAERTKPIREELASLFDRHGPPTKESPMRPKYVLDQLVRAKQGWLKLQEEVRAYNVGLLRPVHFEDFYVIQSTRLPV